jgi:UDP-N-acetylmuramyl pentapeptide synthase
VPALAPYAARLGERLITAPDPLALGPLVAPRLEGGELVVLKASRGVALERILPALTTRATPPR